MKQLLTVCFLMALSCNQLKEVIKKEEVTIPEESLIVVLKSSVNVTDAKALIENSSLIWSGLVIDNSSIKAAVINVPEEKKDFWIHRLKASNIFSSVAIKTHKSIAYIKQLSEDTFVQVSKTSCFGDCPVYDVTLLKNRTVLFNGIKNVLMHGKHEFEISASKMKRVEEMFKKTSFTNYNDSYVDKSLIDFPNTFITHKNKQIEIKLWKKVPLELALAFETFEEILFEQKLIE
ncbi:DUF6438 domain-containing protein [uncultured Polaribacter sp.]|uniref:DUF6438 domain-containing protein n=1 Tax=uncultured Polaribacter sp. TaxID=174711 RepID=UPI002610E8A1|nr:DUF6438 domain-containing protein [uncultured Polaribacter sp.]